MRSYQEIIRAISVRWIIKQTLRAVIYCVNPINFIRLMLRLFKWLLYIALGAIALGMLSLSIGNYANAAEFIAATKERVVPPTVTGSCTLRNNGSWGARTKSECENMSGHPGWKAPAISQGCWPSGSNYECQYANNGGWLGDNLFWRTALTNVPEVYVCKDPAYPMGPKVTANGTVCEKKPLQCLLGSVKDTNAITGKEFCRPLCKGIAGNTYGDTANPVKYFTSMFGSVQIQCYGQCSIETVGGAVNLGSNPNVWQGVIKFTGENCPVQTQGTEEETSTAGANTPVTPPSSSAATDAAQNQLQNAASSAISSQVSGAQGTADLNQVVNKLAEVHNASEKTKAEQNAAIGKIIQNTGKDIQSSIKEAQLAASQGGAGASMGQIQTANAIKDGNAALGTKLDGIKDAIDKGNEDNGKALPPGDTNIDTDPKDIYPHPNDWGTRNYSTVMQQHVAAMNALPLFSGLAGFFQVDFSGGTCPTFTIDAPDLGGGSAGTLVFDMLCNTDFERLFVIIALCVKLLGLYAAFRIALLD
ncbi:hypothetical protein [Aeromonas hydrophila]|uniref:hypothetical protein n=1 Tax=Aeromonas hydrophila TaxID=644 RepID=UPI0036DF06FF